MSNLFKKEKKKTIQYKKSNKTFKFNSIFQIFLIKIVYINFKRKIWT